MLLLKWLTWSGVEHQRLRLDTFACLNGSQCERMTAMCLHQIVYRKWPQLNIYFLKFYFKWTINLMFYHSRDLTWWQLNGSIPFSQQQSNAFCSSSSMRTPWWLVFVFFICWLLSPNSWSPHLPEAVVCWMFSDFLDFVSSFESPIFYKRRKLWPDMLI